MKKRNLKPPVERDGPVLNMDLDLDAQPSTSRGTYKLLTPYEEEAEEEFTRKLNHHMRTREPIRLFSNENYRVLEYERVQLTTDFNFHWMNTGYGYVELNEEWVNKRGIKSLGYLNTIKGNHKGPVVVSLRNEQNEVLFIPKGTHFADLIIFPMSHYFNCI